MAVSSQASCRLTRFVLLSIAAAVATIALKAAAWLLTGSVGFLSLTSEQDYAFGRPTLTRKKLRRLELTAGAPRGRGRPARSGQTLHHELDLHPSRIAGAPALVPPFHEGSTNAGADRIADRSCYSS